MIIVEGMDNTGKTTLVEKLQQEFPVLTYRPSIGNRHDLVSIAEQAADEAWRTDFGLVLADRSRIISEYVYNPVLKKRPIAYTFSTYMELLGGLAGGHHLIIHCFRNVSRIIDTFDERDQLEGVRQHLSTLSSRYEQVMHMMRFLFDVNERGSRVVSYCFDSDRVPDYYTIITGAVRKYVQEEVDLHEREGL